MKRILFLTGREVQYGRNRVLLRAFEELGEVTVLDTKSTSIFYRSVILTLKALWKIAVSKFDLVFIGFYGNLLVLPISLFFKKPLLFDAFISTYDTLCFDRKVIRPGSILGRLAFWLDQRACRAAEVVFVDTDLHKEYFCKTFQLSPQSMYTIPVGCDESIFSPRSVSSQEYSSNFHVLFYCTYLPLHGVETVINAAILMKDEPVEFELVGNGPEYNKILAIAGREKLSRVHFEPPVPPSLLAERIASADICLAGPFGANEKAKRIIPGKLYQILAMQKLAVVTDTPANRNFLVHGESAWFCPPADPLALKEALLFLMKNPGLCQKIALEGRRVFETTSSQVIINQDISQILAARIQ